MNDKELDDFFRNKSEHPDIPYQEEDWEKLEAKLDAPPPPPGMNGSGRGSNGLWIGLLALVIISGAGFGWKYWGYGSGNSDTEANPVATDLSFDSSTEETLDKWNKIDIPKTAEKSISGAALSPFDPSPRPETIPIRAEDNLGDKNESIHPEVDAAGFSYTRNNVHVREERHRIAPVALNQQFQHVLPLDTMMHLKAQQIRGGLLHEGRVEEVSISEPGDNQKKRITGPRFFTTLTLAPDVSALKIKDIQGLGNSVGFNLEYFIHPTISINAGAMYVFKTYQAGESYSTGYVPAPSHVNGSCWVLDLPLNLRYYAFNQRLSRWYLTAGLSSYLMLKEKYKLEYKSYNYGGSAYDNILEVNNKNRHYLNIVNLGIGYERILTNKLSLQVEPYLKLPLKGIGEGDITLKSAGAFVGLKFGW